MSRRSKAVVVRLCLQVLILLSTTAESFVTTHPHSHWRRDISLVLYSTALSLLIPYYTSHSSGSNATKKQSTESSSKATTTEEDTTTNSINPKPENLSHQQPGGVSTENPTPKQALVSLPQKDQNIGEKANSETTDEDEINKVIQEQFESSSFEKALEASIRKANQQLEKLAQELRNLEAKEEAVEDKVDNMSQQLEILAHDIMVRRKLERLAWAIQNVDKLSFEYYHDDEDYRYPFVKDSADLAKRMLWSFRKGLGFTLPPRASMHRARYWGGEQAGIESSRQEFRDLFFEQVYELIGVQPRLEYNKKKNVHVLYYSY